MLPLIKLSLLTPFLLVRANVPSVSVVATSTLVPPFGSGPATYFASSLGHDESGTSYMITCIPSSKASIPTPTPTATESAFDPCQTSLFGTHPLTFYQGTSAWQFIQSPSSSLASAYHSTGCSGFTDDDLYGYFWTASTSTTPTCAALATPLACYVYNDKGGTGLSSDAKEKDMCELGLKDQEVLMVESLEKALVTAKPTATFTDIGHSATGQNPAITVTLKKTGGAGRIRLTGYEIVRVVVAFATVVLLDGI